ncbi:hypothetical protein FOA52_006795 [Chlamydomonas sp. UWO 241]|nr:hypothetical protein FOA52_006795 [Chlamydomonas sp. UWO 241]
MALLNKTARAAMCRRVEVQCAAPRKVSSRPCRVIVSAASTSTPTAQDEFIELNVNKPLGLKFARGNDGGAYVIQNNPEMGNTDPLIQPGDKIVEISASFGEEVWPAQNFGQIMYAIRTRSGTVYLKFKRNFGDMSALEENTDASERGFKKERNGGNYGAGTKEIQERNYVARKEAERKRRELFDDALAKFKAGQIQESLIDFENILAMEPRNYVGDSGARVTTIFKVTQYNIACCYSMLDQVDEGLRSLESCMACGFDNFEQIRKDKNLAKLRESPDKFSSVMDKYDEPVINWNAVKATFSFFNKKE